MCLFTSDHGSRILEPDMTPYGVAKAALENTVPRLAAFVGDDNTSEHHIRIFCVLARCGANNECGHASFRFASLSAPTGVDPETAVERYRRVGLDDIPSPRGEGVTMVRQLLPAGGHPATPLITWLASAQREAWGRVGGAGRKVNATSSCIMPATRSDDVIGGQVGRLPLDREVVAARGWSS